MELFLQQSSSFDILLSEMANRQYFPLIFFLSLAIILSGCGIFGPVGEWFSQGYENTTSYFNAYYNAKSNFNAAETEVQAFLLSQQGKSQSTLQGSQIPATAKQKFGIVIDKCSNILSFYPKSSLVDDALFLIGKSYFYQGEYVRAERKFSELLAQYPASEHVFECQLWFLKTLQKLNRNDDAMKTGEALAQSAREAGEDDVAGEAHFIIGSMYVSQNLSQKALEQFEKAVEVAEDNVLRASTQVRLGDVLFSLEEYERASAAYLKVSAFTSDIYLNYYGRVQAAIAQRSLKKYDSALEILDGLARDFKFNDYANAIRFEHANTLALAGKTDDAVHEYRYVDTTYARTEIGAKAAFELGQLLQTRYGDYQNAKIEYEHASANPTVTVAPAALKKNTALTRYFQLHANFARNDSMLYWYDVDSIWIVKDTTRHSPVKNFVPPQSDSLKLTLIADTLQRLPDSTTTAGVSDSSIAQPVGPQIVRPTKDSLITILSSIAYQLGEVFYSDLEVADSALFWFNQSLKLRVDSVQAPRILFIVAEIIRSNPQRYGDPKETYDRLLREFPSSSYTEKAKAALGLPLAPKALDPAGPYYAQAESLVESGQYHKAVKTFTEVTEKFQKSSLVAKSKYSIAWIYEHRLSKPDSALSYYKDIVENFGNTEYAVAAKRKIPDAPSSKTAPTQAPADSLSKPAAQPPQVIPKSDIGPEERDVRKATPTDSTQRRRRIIKD